MALENNNHKHRPCMTLTTRLLSRLLPSCRETTLTHNLRYHLPGRSASATSGRPFARQRIEPAKSHRALLSRSGQALPKSSESRILPEQIPEFVEQAVTSWASKPILRRRLQSFGIPDGDLRRLLKEFIRAVRLGRFSDEEAFRKYSMNRFSAPFPLGGKTEHVDRIFTNVFYAWACDPEIRPSLEKLVQPSTISGMQQLQEAADMTYPADSFVAARAMRRKVIMHVGPTNSGKTHNALRALAAAKSGLYAGPLRLLAHEVWKRLNQGQIVPLGVDPEPDSTSDSDVALDLLDESKNAAPTVRKDGNPKYARPCNLLTGEMAKIVAPEAPLLSATVEMTSFKTSYDVAVVDEIQMVADPERGSAWTNAVLGLCAKELHLCGEESAVPLVEEMLKETGDKLTVHRYQRLTPLVVEDQSLRGDLSLVRKGDCIVAFTRTRIFALKRLVERTTGLRCAVAYGRLPPEVRSDQAALFNDPESGYDVMIGSDALGMGLNLKIKRVIFESVHKWDGRVQRLLSTSQLKQIAGRAGRYDQHEARTPAGLATTLSESDLPILREALSSPLQPLQHAYVSASLEHLAKVSQALPPQSPTSAIHQVHSHIAKMKSIYLFEDSMRLLDRCQFIDDAAGELTLEDRTLFMKSPIAWWDPLCVQVAAEFMVMYKRSLRVVLLDALRRYGLMNTLRKTELWMNEKRPLASLSDPLSLLETLHKVLVLYMWLGIRNPIAYGDCELATELKGRVETALDWYLETLSWRAKKGERGIVDGKGSRSSARQPLQERRVAFQSSRLR